MKAVILDRDGVINDNSEDYYIYNNERWKYVPDLIESLSILQVAGFELFVISNQGGISKGEYSRGAVEELNAWFVNDLQKKGVHIKEVLVCPHHNSIENCFCRKPKVLLYERLVARYGIEVTASLAIGDSDRDIEAARAIGLRGLKCNSNQSILALCKQIVEGV
jgi:D-glycero-D-manno-heptose 1,7-bisphosphate phosphatase